MSVTESVLQHCREMLEIPEISENDCLVVLGASSMRLMQFVARLYESFGVIVELSEVMEDKPLSQLITMIEERRSSEPESTLAAPLMDQTLTELQLPFWDLRINASAMVAYNEACSYVIEGPLDIEACREVLRQIVAAHPALRCAFLEEDGVPIQRELPMEDIAGMLQLETVDLRSFRNPMEECRRQFKEVYSTRFDLSRPPLFRVVAWRIGDAKWVLSCVLYHIVADLWSVDVVKAAAGRLYKAVLQGAPPPESPRTAAADAAAALSFSAEDEAFWLASFSSPPPRIDLSRRRRPPIKSYAGDMVIRPLDDVPASELQGAREDHAVTMSTLTFAAYCLLIHALSGARDMTIGVPFLNRQYAELQHVVGLFVNTLPVRVRIREADRMRDLVRSCHDSLRAAYEHGRYPVNRLLKHLSLPSKLDRSPLFEQHFTYYERDDEIYSGETGIRVTDIDLPRGTTKFDLTFFVTRKGDSLTCKAEYSTALFDEGEIHVLIDLYESVLRMLARRDDMTVDAAAELVRRQASRAAEIGPLSSQPATL